MQAHERVFAAAALIAAAMLTAAFSAHAAPPEPEGLWTGTMLSDTPDTLTGAQVIDVSGLEALMARNPVLVDSGPADRKPETLPVGTLWKPMHRSIPGAAWFPGAGSGDLPQEKADALLRRIDELSHGDRSAPIVTFCQPRCWGSWNVGKRLVQAGYSSVYWFPAGLDGWQEHHETTAVQPEPGWGPKP